MSTEEIEAILAATEQALATRERVDLAELGYWRAVSAVKRHPEWISRFAARIGAIDREIFVRRVRWRFPIGVFIAALGGGTLLGLAMILAAFRAPPRRKDLLLLVGPAVLAVTTHDLAHFLVGRALGIRFTAAFLGGKAQIEPGLKVEYASYLRTPPRQRAIMHAAGAIATKLVLILAALVARLAGASTRTIALLSVAAVASILTDVFLSTRYSDWRRVRRELRIARQREPGDAR